MKKEIAELYSRIEEKNPLIHCITNYVTANDCANILLAVGASPVMAEAKEEVAEVTSHSDALVLNMGTLRDSVIESLFIAADTANKKQIPVILDPVGVGISSYRRITAQRLLSDRKVDVIRGNCAEIAILAGKEIVQKGVDDNTDQNLCEKKQLAEYVAKKFQCVTVITGKIDLISDGKRTITLTNGVPMLKKVTGTGCMTTALIGAYSAVENDTFLAALEAVAVMGISGEISYNKSGLVGTGSFHLAILDAASKLTTSDIENRIKMKEMN